LTGSDSRDDDPICVDIACEVPDVTEYVVTEVVATVDPDYCADIICSIPDEEPDIAPDVVLNVVEQAVLNVVEDVGGTIWNTIVTIISDLVGSLLTETGRPDVPTAQVDSVFREATADLSRKGSAPSAEELVAARNRIRRQLGIQRPS
jgi:hypothetical protein